MEQYFSVLFIGFVQVDDDSTPPPTKKQRKSSSSDSDFFETQLANKTNESKPDEQPASTSLSAATPIDDESVEVLPKPTECSTNPNEDQLPHAEGDDDDEMNGKKATIEPRPVQPAKANLSTSPTSFSNSSSVSTGSNSPESHSLPISTSAEHEPNLEKDIERKLLQKIEYHLMDIFQHLDETETAMESEASSSRYGSQSKANCTAGDGASSASANITATSHKIASATSSIAADDIANEPGPSQ